MINVALLNSNNAWRILTLYLSYVSQQQSPIGEKVSLKHQLLQVIVRVAQYRMLLTGED